MKKEELLKINTVPTEEECILSAIKFQIQQFFDKVGISYKISWSYEKTILNYFDLVQKLIFPCPRSVEYSHELKQKMQEVLDEETVEVIKIFTDDFILGKNMNCHLSTNISKSGTKDYLLNVWNIYHLHLNKKVVSTIKDMKKNREGLLLVCIVSGTKVYFVDVIPHPTTEDFLNLDFLRIVQANGWMKEIGFREIEGYISGSITPAIEECDKIFKMYTSGMNIGFDVNGKGYLPSNVIASSRDSMQYVEKYNRIILAIRELLKSGNFVEFQLYHPFHNKFGSIIIKNWVGEYVEYELNK